MSLCIQFMATTQNPSKTAAKSARVSSPVLNNSGASRREPAESPSTSPASARAHTQSVGEGAESEVKKQPIHKENGLAIWAVDKEDSENRPDYYVKLTRSFGSSLFTGASEQNPVTFNVYAQQKNGPFLSAIDVARTIKGELVEGVFQSVNPEARKPEYNAFIAPQKIVNTPRKNDDTKENRTLWLGRAFPVFKTDDDHQRLQWGWEIERVIFPLNVRHGNRTLTFTPAHGFQLINTGKAIVDGHQAAYVGSEAKHEGQTPVAKLQITAINRDQAERPRMSGAKESYSP